jgi:AcrR family transcriptional regulator
MAAAQPPNQPVPVRRRILDAARECFSRFGVARTRIEDVTRAAGISRPLLYLHFDGRSGLIEALIDDEIARLVEENRKRLPADGTFAEMLIEGSLAAVELGRSDALLADLFEASSMEDLPGLLLNADKPPHAMVLGLWRPVFDRARETGELRGDLSDDDLIEWLMTVHYVLLLRNDVGQDRQRELLEHFVVPALLAGAAVPSRRATGRKAS